MNTLADLFNGVPAVVVLTICGVALTLVLRCLFPDEDGGEA